VAHYNVEHLSGRTPDAAVARRTLPDIAGSEVAMLRVARAM
jgi:hypothetical protein